MLLASIKSKFKFWKNILFLVFLILPQVSMAQTPNPPVNATTNTASNSTANTTGRVDKTIKDLLCAPSSDSPLGSGENSSNDLYICINKFYRFSIAFASIGAVFMITVAGYLYIGSDGSEEQVTKAKEILVSSIASLVILFIAFVFLREINPDLVNFKIIQPISVTGVPGSGGGNGGGFVTGGGTGGGGGSCSATERGSCTKANLSACSAWDVTKAVKACNVESGGGNPNVCSGADICRQNGQKLKLSDGSWMSFSCGLFQINLTVHQNDPQLPAVCNNLFTGRNYNCNLPVANEGRYKQCIQAIENVQFNVNFACKLYKQSGWAPWTTTRNKCGF